MKNFLLVLLFVCSVTSSWAQTNINVTSSNSFKVFTNAYATYTNSVPWQYVDLYPGATLKEKFDAAYSAMGGRGTLVLGRGTYTISSPLIIGPNNTNSAYAGFKLVGASIGIASGTTIIQSTLGSPILVVTNSGNVQIEGITFLSVGNTGDAVNIYDSTSSSIKHCAFSAAGGGVGFLGSGIEFLGDTSHGWFIEENTFQNNGFAISWTGSVGVNEIVIQKNRLGTTDRTVDRTGILVGVGSGVIIRDNRIESHRVGIDIPGNSATTFTQVYVGQNYLEDNDYCNIWWGRASGSAIVGLAIVNNYLNGQQCDVASIIGTNQVFGYSDLGNINTPDAATASHYGGVSNFRTGSSINGIGVVFADYTWPTNVIVPPFNLAGRIPSRLSQLMTADLTPTLLTLPDDYLLDPNGTNRTVNPSGSFFVNQQVVIHNLGTGTNIITFDSGVLNRIIYPGQTKKFYYTGSLWKDAGSTTLIHLDGITRATRDALSPANGDIIYQTDSTAGLRAYIGGAWYTLDVTADP